MPQPKPRTKPQPKPRTKPQPSPIDEASKLAAGYSFSFLIARYLDAEAADDRERFKVYSCAISIKAGRPFQELRNRRT